MELPRLADGSLDLAGALSAARAAAERLRPYVRETPTVYSFTFSESAGCDVFLKLESLQRTGSFKLRGAANKLLSLPPAARARGIVAASAGNHAQGVALAAKLLGMQATVVMPEGTPLIKLRRTEGYGARVIVHGASWNQAQERALALAAEHGLVAVHPFDDAEVVIGQATVGLEILAQVPDLDALVVPVGGGGLLAGIALVVKACAPRVRVIGVQAAGADPLARSLAAGRRLSVERPETIADGIRVGTTGALTFEVVRAFVDEMVTVADEDIAAAIVDTIEKSKLVAEPAGVAAIAALASGRIAARGRICAVLSGGNIDLNLLGRLIEGGLASRGLYHPVQVRLRDVPGELARVLEVLAETECNILDVQHYRSGWRVPLGWVDVEILVETRRAEHGAELESLLRERGFALVAPGSGAASGRHKGPPQGPSPA